MSKFVPSIKIISDNIAELIIAGHSPKQAATIAYSEAKKSLETAVVTTPFSSDNSPNTEVATSISDIKETPKKIKREVPNSDPIVQLIQNDRFVQEANEAGVSTTINIGHGVGICLFRDASLRGSADRYTGYMEIGDPPGSEHTVLIGIAPRAIGFHALTIPNLVWYLYEKGIVDRRSHEQKMRDEKIDEFKAKINEYAREKFGVELPTINP